MKEDIRLNLKQNWDLGVKKNTRKVVKISTF